MRVAAYLADQNPHRDRSLGITRYTDTVLRALVDQGDELTVVSSRSSYNFPRARQVRLPLSTDRMATRVLTDQLHGLWPGLSRLDADVWLYPKGFLPWLSRVPGPTVAGVLDVILQHYADRYPGERGAANLHYFLAALAHTLQRATTIVTLSHASRRQIEAFCARRGLRVPTIEVVYPASDFEDLATPDTPPIKHQSVLHLASRAPHKRTAWLLSAWQRLQARGRDLPELVLVGGVPDAARQSLSACRGVVVRQGLSDAALQSTMGAARALLMPSEIEGFGLPVLEAYYLGTPGLYQAGTAIDEYMAPVSQAGRFERDDLDDFEAALDRVLALSTATIAETAGALKARYGRAVFGPAMHDVLERAAA